VYNDDEMGQQEFSDIRQRLCVVRAHVMKDAYYEIARQGKKLLCLHVLRRTVGI
jgi:hypothetical protein